MAKLPVLLPDTEDHCALAQVTGARYTALRVYLIDGIYADAVTSMKMCECASINLPEMMIGIKNLPLFFDSIQFNIAALSHD